MRRQWPLWWKICGKKLHILRKVAALSLSPSTRRGVRWWRREHIDHLIDPGSPFLELSQLAGIAMIRLATPSGTSWKLCGKESASLTRGLGGALRRLLEKRKKPKAMWPPKLWLLPLKRRAIKNVDQVALRRAADLVTEWFPNETSNCHVLMMNL